MVNTVWLTGKWKGPETGSSNGKHKKGAALGGLPEFGGAKLGISQSLYISDIQQHAGIGYF